MLDPITIRSDAPLPEDHVSQWLRMFAEQGASPLAIIGVRTADGVPVIAAVEKMGGEPFDLRQLLTDILVRLGGR